MTIQAKRSINKGSLRGTVLAGALLSLWALNAAASGGAAGGGGTKPAPVPAPAPVPVVAILPTTAPAPDVILRESFGFADAQRPAGGKGTPKPYYVGASIAGFWVEYPGSSKTAWLAPAEPAQTWKVCGASVDPYEMPSPLQLNGSNGCMFSDFFDPIADHPAALMPFNAPSTPYQISMDAWPTGAPGADPGYLGFGLTSSSVLASNLETSGSIWFEITGRGISETITYTLRLDGRTGPVLATGTTMFDPHSRVVIRYYPATGTISASLNEMELGTFQHAIATPRYVAFEGVGIVDNLVVRNIP